MSFVRQERTISAVFDSEVKAREALDDLRSDGAVFHGAQLEVLPPGRYLLEGEPTPELSLRGRVAIGGYSLVGGLIGIAIVAVATSLDASIGGYIAGFLSGALFGLVVGGVVATSFMLPDDDDEDEWLTVSAEHPHVSVVGQADAGHDVRRARAILADHRPLGFLSTRLRRAA